MNNSEKRKKNVALISVISNITLVVSKLVIGLLIGSVSIISEAIHSGVDLLAAIIAYISVRKSSKPADEEHPFGHGKIENISGTVEGLLIFLAGGWIIYEAALKLTHPEPIHAAPLGIAVMLMSAVMNLAVSHQLFKVGRETDSIALQADGWHLRTDVYTSAGIMIGLTGIALSRIYLPQYPLSWIDPVCALAVAALIMKTAYRLTVEAARDLLDANLPNEDRWIRKFLESHKPVVHGYHNLRTRKSGSTRFIDFHIQVDPDMTVAVSHSFAQELSGTIKEHFDNSTVTIHIEPCTGHCTEKCMAGCILTDLERAAIRKKQGGLRRIEDLRRLRQGQE